MSRQQIQELTVELEGIYQDDWVSTEEASYDCEVIARRDRKDCEIVRMLEDARSTYLFSQIFALILNKICLERITQGYLE